MEQNEPRRLIADVPPLDVDGVRAVEVGTLIWLVAFVGMLPFYGRLEDDGHGWWLWTCLAGGVLGMLGYALMGKHRREGRAP